MRNYKNGRRATTFIAVYFTVAVILLLLFVSVSAYAQNDSINVKVTKIIVKDSVTHVWMKTDKGVKLYTECKCKVPYKKNDTVMIRKPE